MCSVSRCSQPQHTLHWPSCRMCPALMKPAGCETVSTFAQSRACCWCSGLHTDIRQHVQKTFKDVACDQQHHMTGSFAPSMPIQAEQHNPTCWCTSRCRYWIPLLKLVKSAAVQQKMPKSRSLSCIMHWLPPPQRSKPSQSRPGSWPRRRRCSTAAFCQKQKSSDCLNHPNLEHACKLCLLAFDNFTSYA